MTALRRRARFTPPRFELFAPTAVGYPVHHSGQHRVARLRAPVRSSLLEQLCLKGTEQADAKTPSDPLSEALARTMRLRRVEEGGEAPWPDWMAQWVVVTDEYAAVALRWLDLRTTYIHHNGWDLKLWVQLSAARVHTMWHVVDVDVIISAQDPPPMLQPRRRGELQLLELSPVASGSRAGAA